MYYNFEETNALNAPIECFYFDSTKETFPIKPHWHYFAEFIYVLDGNAEMHSDNDIFYLSPADMILFHPKVIHSIYVTDPMPLRYAVIKFDINTMNRSSEYAPKFRSIFHIAQKQKQSILLSAKDTETMNIKELFHSCIQEMNSQQYGFDLVVRSRLYILLTDLIRFWQEHGLIINNEAFTEDDLHDIYSVTEYIDQHVNEGLAVTEVAKFCGLSYSYFNKCFFSIYGKTCKEYMEEVRIKKAEQFLLFTNFDLNYIAHEIGFSDCSHMIKSFKQQKGITPKQFRMQSHISDL